MVVETKEPKAYPSGHSQYRPGEKVPYYGPGYYSQHSQGYLQMSHMTKPERFPLIFDSAKQFQPDAKRVLSFGCSTGEEAFALAKRFPDAEIVGVDIDYYSIQQARKHNKDKDRIFFHTELGATGKYDVITCLMVLFQMDSPIKFKPWDDVLCLLNKHLNLEGVLMLYTSEYNFLQSSVAVNFDVIRDWTRQHNRNEKEYFCGYYRKKRDLEIKRVAPPKEPEKPQEEKAEKDDNIIPMARPTFHGPHRRSYGRDRDNDCDYPEQSYYDFG